MRRTKRVGTPSFNAEGMTELRKLEAHYRGDSLEKVAREMLAHIGIITALLHERGLTSEAKLNAEDFARFDMRLKDLGVVVDG